MPVPVAAVGAAVNLIGGLFGSGKARRAARRQRRLAKSLQKKLDHLERNRQSIINPYDNVTSLASMATDLSNTLSNPFANLSVATKAAEMKIEEADISLANTLDTLRATGAGAGGATALAQAALKAKQGVTASIEQQEKANEDRRAQGEAQLQQQVMSEKQRIQNISISEGAREQSAMAQGRAFEFNAREQREMQKLNRVAGQLDQATNNAAQASRDATSAITGAIGGMASSLSAGKSAGNLSDLF